MKGKWFSLAGLVAAAISLSSVSSCARNRHLTSIQVLPATVTFGGIGSSLQFTAIGTYEHPPETKDISASVTWSVDSQNLVSFGPPPGLATAVSNCGSGNVTASMQDGGNDIFGSAFVSTSGQGTTACTQAVLTVIVAGAGSVASSPTGITCPGTCNAAFPLDATVGLNATPGTGATTVNWSWPLGTAGCATVTTTACTVALNTNQAITATFQ